MCWQKCGATGTHTLLRGRRDGTATLERSLTDTEALAERLLGNRIVTRCESHHPTITFPAKGKNVPFQWRDLVVTPVTKL